MDELVLDIRKRVDALVVEVDGLKINSDDDYRDAENGQSRSLNIEKEIKRRFEELEAEPKKRLKDLAELKKPLLKGLERACNIITNKRAVYEGLRDQMERDRLEEKHKEQKRKMKIEAQKMEEAKVPKDVIESILEQNDPVLDLDNIPELQSRTTIKWKYKAWLESTEFNKKISWLESAKKLQKAEPDLLLPTTEKMKTALEAKIEKIINADYREMPGVKIKQIAITRRKDFK